MTVKPARRSSLILPVDHMGGPEMAPDFPGEGSYAPLGLPRPQRSSRRDAAVARLGIPRDPGAQL